MTRCFSGSLTASATQPLIYGPEQSWRSPSTVCVSPTTACYDDGGGGGGLAQPLFADPCDFDPTGPCCNSPILIDLDGGGFRLTGPADPVSFDLNSDGVAERISWTEALAQTGILALDRNGNGTIDSGRELFGNHTLLPDGTEGGNGYVALRPYDTAALGGNDDGFIDEHDAIFEQLRVWVDANHNGRSEVSELLSLDEAAVVRISLAYA